MKVAIVGGGPAGIAAAMRLAGRAEVTLFEASEQLGGLARSFEKDGYRIPVFYHHILPFDKITKQMVSDVGLEEKYARSIKMGLSFENKTYTISKVATLFWNFLSPQDKLRFGLLYLHAKVKKNWKDIEGMNADEWLGRVVGANVRDKIFAPLMWVKYGIPLNMISASELAERLGAEEATGRLTYPEGGFHEMYKRLEASLRKTCAVEMNAPVTGINLEKSSLTYKREGREVDQSFDAVINTSPLPIFLRATKGLPVEYKERLAQIQYTRGVCLSVGMSEHLSDYYWLNVFDKHFSIVVEHTILADAYPFKMAWVSRYAPPDETWALSDEDVGKLFADGVREIFPNFKPEWIITNRAAYASPLYDINYLKYMPSPDTPLKNLYFAGIAVTYPKLRSQNTAFESGFETAELIIKQRGL